jgi:hypothetical protein
MRPYIFYIAAGSTAILAGLAAANFLGHKILQDHDFGTMAPNEVFQRVFHSPLPSGILSQQIAGQAAGQSGTVWMRLKVRDPDKVLSELKEHTGVVKLRPRSLMKKSEALSTDG